MLIAFLIKVEEAARSKDSRALKAIVNHWKVPFTFNTLKEAFYGCAENVEIIVQNCKFSHGQLRSLAEWSSKHLDTSCLEVLLQYTTFDIEVNKRDRVTALAVSCATDDLQLVETVFEIEAEEGESGLVNAEVGNGSYLDQEETCLTIAVNHNSNRVLERMLRCPEVNLSLGNRERPLENAAGMRNLKAVEMLSNHHKTRKITTYKFMYIVLHHLPRFGEEITDDLVKVIRSVLSRCEMEAEELPKVINWYDRNKRSTVVKLMQLVLDNENLAKEIEYDENSRACPNGTW